MKKSFTMFSGLILCGMMVGCASTPPVAEVPYVSQKVSLSTEMKAISANLKAFHQAQDAVQAKTALTQLRTAVERSQSVLPKKIDIADTQQVGAYMNDLNAMLKVIDQSVALVDAGQLDQAKNTIKQLDAIKDQAHKAYR